MSGRTGVNEWAGRHCGTPKEFGIVAPYAGQQRGHNIGLGLGLGHGPADEEAGLGTFGAHSIVVEEKHAVNKLFDAM